MSRRALRSQTIVCQICDFLTTRQRLVKPMRFRAITTKSSKSTISRRTISSTAQLESSSKRDNSNTTVISNQPEVDFKIQNGLETARVACRNLIMQEGIPSSEQVLSALKNIEDVTDLYTEDTPIPTLESKDSSAASALLALRGSKTEKHQPRQPSHLTQSAITEAAGLAYLLVTHPPVFITPEILTKYIKIVASVGKPNSIPMIFDLYAKKPVPREKTLPTRYYIPNPNKITSAIPEAVAETALQAAINAKNLDVALAIVETAYSNTAYKRSRFFRKAFPAISGLGLLPFAGYSLARQLAPLQTTMDSATATNVAFVGFLAYVGLTSTVGFVAITTANDQMDRVTWAQGMPLRERWIREDERAAIDKIAQAWGFKETWRRGEEEGLDWETLKEWTGSKGMWLDRVELMDGME